MPTDPKLETRYLPLQTAGLELRAAEGDGMPTLVGYAAVYDSRSSDLGGFVETIRQGAFSQSLSRGVDVRALINHDSARILGRTKSNTCTVTNNQKGLRYEVPLPDTSYARDLVASIKRGDIQGSSFAFRTIEDAWREEILDGQRLVVRELIEVEVHDVSPVTDPAYPATEVGLRSLDVFRQQQIIRPGLAVLQMRLALAERGF